MNHFRKSMRQENSILNITNLNLLKSAKMEKNQNTIKIMTFSIHSQIQRWRKNKTTEEEEVIEETISEVEEMANIEVEEVAIEGETIITEVETTITEVDVETSRVIIKPGKDVMTFSKQGNQNTQTLSKILMLHFMKMQTEKR
mgnify:FL=1|jgi:hypothetical protein